MAAPFGRLCRAGRCTFHHGEAQGTLPYCCRSEDEHFVLQVHILQMNLTENDQGYQMYIFFSNT